MIMETTQKTNFAAAIELAERVRCEHNGVFGVRLFMGHDGHNECILENYECEVGRGESGTSLLIAIERAVSDRRFRQLTSDQAWAKETLEDAFENAILDMGDPNGVFCSAGFYAALNKDACATVSQTQCEAILEQHPRIVRLKGGTLWMRLPGKMNRHVPA